MAALHWQNRLTESAKESVEDLAQVKQIAEPAEIVRCGAAIWGRRTGASFVPIGPFCWNERATAVGQAQQEQQNAAPSNAAERRQALAFEGVALAGNGHRRWNLAVMGSLRLLPSAAFPIPNS
jgi:hypothetical protein